MAPQVRGKWSKKNGHGRRREEGADQAADQAAEQGGRAGRPSRGWPSVPISASNSKAIALTVSRRSIPTSTARSVRSSLAVDHELGEGSVLEFPNRAEHNQNVGWSSAAEPGLSMPLPCSTRQPVRPSGRRIRIIPPAGGAE
jgi:hypothetical protein